MQKAANNMTVSRRSLVDRYDFLECRKGLLINYVRVPRKGEGVGKISTYSLGKGVKPILT